MGDTMEHAAGDLEVSLQIGMPVGRPYGATFTVAGRGCGSSSN